MATTKEQEKPNLMYLKGYRTSKENTKVGIVFTDNETGYTYKVSIIPTDKYNQYTGKKYTSKEYSIIRWKKE